MRVEGDLRRVTHLGAGMTGGRLTVAGDAGLHAGAGMRGGELVVEGDAGDWAGAGMRGGTARRARLAPGAGSAAPTPGERAGMRGGEIVVHGDAGDAGRRRAAARPDRGRRARRRRRRPAHARRHDRRARRARRRGPGPGMRRGSIVAMAPATPLPTFASACTYRPPFLRLCLRRLRALGLPVSDEQLDGRYARWSGDGLELGRGEILILEAAA